MTVTIKYGDETFYCEGDYDEVCKAIVDGKSLEVYESSCSDAKCRSCPRKAKRITFFGDPDYVSVAL